MKAYTKLLSILLIVAMFCSFGIVTAAAEENVGQDANVETSNEETLNEETNDEEPAVDEEPGEESVQTADLVVNGIVVKAGGGVSSSGSKTDRTKEAIAESFRRPSAARTPSPRSRFPLRRPSIMRPLPTPSMRLRRARWSLSCATPA